MTQPPADTRVYGDLEELPSREEIIREWVGGERYARDYEYCDIHFGPHVKRILALFARHRLSTATPVPATAEGVRNPNPPRVYLEPLCQEGIERRWSEQPWEQCEHDNCVHCGSKAPADWYVRADLTTPSPAQIEAGAFERAAKDEAVDGAVERDEAIFAGQTVLAGAGNGTYDEACRAISGLIAAIRAEARVPARGGAGDGGDDAERLSDLLDQERYKVAIGVQAIRKAIDGRRWLSEPGRGSYTYDDERYQAEFGGALDEIDAALEPLRKIAGDWSDCPRDPLRVAANRSAALAASPPAASDGGEG